VDKAEQGAISECCGSRRSTAPAFRLPVPQSPGKAQTAAAKADGLPAGDGPGHENNPLALRSSLTLPDCVISLAGALSWRMSMLPTAPTCISIPGQSL
jgi:hypothetical protein